MDQLDREVIESLSEPAKRAFGSLDYRSRQRMLKKAQAMAKEEKRRNQKKSRVKKKGIEKQNKAKRKKQGSSSKSERVFFSIYETKDLMVQSMHLMLLGSSVADNAYEERDLEILLDDECIIFVRGENTIRDKKWFPWEHEQYLEARKCGAFNPKEQQEKQKKPMEECDFLGEESLNYLKLQKDKNENIRLYELDAFSFMMMDLDEMEKKIHSTPNDKKGKAREPTITAGMIQSALHAEKEREEAERKAWFVENFDSLTLLDIYASEWIGEIRRNVIRDLLQAEASEEVIKSIIRPEIEEGQVLQKKAMWMEMEEKA